MEEKTCLLLIKHAAELSGAICCATRDRRIKPSEACYSLAHDIAVGLHLINEYLGSLPPYWVEPDVEELCRSLLADLQDVVLVRMIPCSVPRDGVH